MTLPAIATQLITYAAIAAIIGIVLAITNAREDEPEVWPLGEDDLRTGELLHGGDDSGEAQRDHVR